MRAMKHSTHGRRMVSENYGEGGLRWMCFALRRATEGWKRKSNDRTEASKRPDRLKSSGAEEYIDKCQMRWRCREQLKGG